MKIYLFICTRHREFGIFNFLRYLRLPKALQGTLFWKKMILYEIFQVGACPNLKDSSLYDRFSIHMYKAWSVWFLWLFCAICDSLMPCTVHFVEKDDFFSWNISSWCMPQLERFLNIWTVFYSYVQDIESSVSSTFCAICDSLKLCKVHYFGKRWFFSWNISSWCMPQLERFFIIWQVF